MFYKFLINACSSSYLCLGARSPNLLNVLTVSLALSIMNELSNIFLSIYCSLNCLYWIFALRVSISADGATLDATNLPKSSNVPIFCCLNANICDCKFWISFLIVPYYLYKASVLSNNVLWSTLKELSSLNVTPLLMSLSYDLNSLNWRW